MRQHPRSRKSYAFTLKEVHKHEKLIKVILKRRKTEHQIKHLRQNGQDQQTTVQPEGTAYMPKRNQEENKQMN